MQSSKKGFRTGLYRRVFVQLQPYSRWLFGILLLELLSIPLTLLLPLPMKLAVDSLTGGGRVPALVQRMLPTWLPGQLELLLAAALMLAVGLFQHLVGFSNWQLQTFTSENLIRDFRSQLFEHVQRLSLTYHDRKGSSDPTYRIQYDAPAISHIAIQGIIPSTTALLTLVGMLYITARIDWQLAIVAVVVSPCLLLITRHYSRWLRDQWIEVKDRDSQAMSVIQEVLNSLRVVKAFGQEEREHGRFLKHSGKYMRGQLRLTLLQSSFYVIIGLTLVIASTVGLYIGARHVRLGILTIGDMLLVIAYLGKLYEPLSMLSSKWIDMQSSLVSVERAFELLDQQPEVLEKPHARSIRTAKGAVAFQDVSFQYVPSKPVLREVSFEVSPGTHVGICGRTGAGKSTLLALLTRLYDPVMGAILLDGLDLRDYKLRALRKQFSIVLQDPVLFSTSIGDNIAYAVPGASKEDVAAAAKAAHAHEFISRLPEGYNTQVGQRGMQLSGGERQRISLARAFLKNSPVLFLDEPTSSVDPRTEAGIVDAVEKLVKNRTTFVIAHRPSVLQHCDVQFELSEGKLLPITWDVESILAPALPPVRSGLHSLSRRIEASGVETAD